MGTEQEWQAARDAVRGRQFEAAIEHLLAVLEENDEDAEACCFLGAAYGQLGRFVEAEFYLSKACELAPNMPQAHYNLGRCFQARKLTEMAIRSYENALRADHHYHVAREALTQLHATLSPDVRDEETEEVAEEQAEAEPEHSSQTKHSSH